MVEDLFEVLGIEMADGSGGVLVAAARSFASLFLICRIAFAYVGSVLRDSHCSGEEAGGQGSASTSFCMERIFRNAL